MSEAESNIHCSWAYRDDSADCGAFTSPAVFLQGRLLWLFECAGLELPAVKLKGKLFRITACHLEAVVPKNMFYAASTFLSVSDDLLHVKSKAKNPVGIVLSQDT